MPFMAPKFRIGFGFDVHPLVEGCPLYLGGKLLEAEKGAYGHSDADVLIHAIADALLGAANLRDIGYHFSNQDSRWKGIRSTVFLEEIQKLLNQNQYFIGNIDATLCLETPKINPHISDMQEILSKCLGIEADQISIKATTNEKLGFIGREEGLTAYAVALIYKA
jgi:2-C-methyl-D-erythritol 2,4-cyclodiphosphate synthase